MKLGRVFQVARKRRLSVYPDKFGMEQDICNVTLWLIEKHSLSHVHAWVIRPDTQIDRNDQKYLRRHLRSPVLRRA